MRKEEIKMPNDNKKQCMGGDCMIGTCEVCGKKDVPLMRTYFYYGIPCECHSPEHVEIVEHCRDCKPKEPRETRVTLSTAKLRAFGPKCLKTLIENKGLIIEMIKEHLEINCKVNLSLKSIYPNWTPSDNDNEFIDKIKSLLNDLTEELNYCDSIGAIKIPTKSLKENDLIDINNKYKCPACGKVLKFEWESPHSDQKVANCCDSEYYIMPSKYYAVNRIIKKER